MAKEGEIKLIAYNIWEQQGYPNGRDCEHWFLAESIWSSRSKRLHKKTPKPSPKMLKNQPQQRSSCKELHPLARPTLLIDYLTGKYFASPITLHEYSNCLRSALPIMPSQPPRR
jgi:Protein of unknown function (DUF2934)